MKKTSLVTVAVSACLFLASQPGHCQKNVRYKVEETNLFEIKQTQNGWNKTPSTYITPNTISPSAQPGGSGGKPGLPGTPMGAAVRQPGDLLYKKTAPSNQPKQGKGLEALSDTRMGATVGMAGDHVGQKKGAASKACNGIGPPGTRSVSKVGTAGDGMRSNPGGNNNRRLFPTERVVRVRKQPDAAAGQPAQSNSAASYGDYDKTVKKRNY